MNLFTPCQLSTLLLMLSMGLLPTADAQIIGWTNVASPNPGAIRSQYRGISGTSSSDIWAVGYYQTSPANQNFTGSNLITHWNGNEWQVFPSLDLTTNNDLYDVEAVSANDVWAAGTTGPNARPQILHYNGSTWSQQSIPNIPNTAYLNALKAFSASDIWAVGGRSPVGTTLPYPVYALHYNGSAWAEIPITPLGNGWHEFADIDGASANDVWGLGFWNTIPTYANSKFLAMHWNGSVWENLTSALPASITSQEGHFTKLKVFASNDIWAIGELQAGGYVMLHYDGSSWTEVSHPVSSGSLNGASSTDFYSFGGEISHYNGAGWTITDSLSQQIYPALIASVLLPGGEIWAAGRTVDLNNIFQTLVYRSIGSVPRFVNNDSQQLQVPANTASPVDNLLVVADNDISQILQYRVLTPSLHGIISGLPTTAITSNGLAMPSGINYTPNAGYTGLDSFSVEVRVGDFADTTTIVADSQSIVPVIFRDFSLSEHPAGVLLQWSTFAEENASTYLIERSPDGVNYFPLETVLANGNSNVISTYQFVDQRPVEGSNYYRLSLTDRDGAKQVFPIRMITLKNNNPILMYPNPVSEYLMIKLKQPMKGTVSIREASGKLVRRIRLNEIENKIDVRFLANGLYNIQWIPDNDHVGYSKWIAIQK